MPRARLVIASLCLLAAACGGRIALDADSSPDAGDRTPVRTEVDASAPPSVLDAGPVSPPSRDASSDAACDGAPCRSSIDAAAIAPCLVGGNVLHLEGDPGDPVFSGVTTFTAASGRWTGGGAPMVFAVGLWRDAGTSWVVQLAAPWEDWLSVGTYEDAGRLMGYGKSSLLLSADDHPYACEILTGRFVVTEMTGGQNDHFAVASITASFERFCQGVDAGLRGCVRYNPP